MRGTKGLDDTHEYSGKWKCMLSLDGRDDSGARLWERISPTLQPFWYPATAEL